MDDCLTYILPSITLLAGVVLRIKIPPINDLYGYRMRRSSKNEETWIFANKLAAILMIIFSSILLLVSSLLLIFKYILNSDINFIWFFIAEAAIIIGFPVLITELTLAHKDKRSK